MAEPLVSVKMITYNHAPFIARAIESILQQKTKYPFEIVIGEDCSTDGTREIVFEYQKKYPDIIRVITSDRNVGMKKNGLRTTRACRGEYVAYCEGDDYWHHLEKMQKQVHYLSCNQNCGLVFTDYDFNYVNSKKIVNNVNQSKGFKSQRDLSIEEIIGETGPVIRTCTIMVRRRLLEKIISDDPYLHQSDTLLMGDVQLFAEMAVISSVSYLPDSMSTYTIIEESASRSNDQIKSCRFWKSYAEMKLYLCDKYHLSDHARHKSETAWCNSALRLALYTRDGYLADEVRSKNKSFSWKEWIRYFGSKYSAIYYGYIGAIKIKQLVNKHTSLSLTI